MLDFFIALFGSVFYGKKYAEDRALTKAAAARDKVYNTYSEKVNHLAQQKKLHSLFCSDRYAVLEEISDHLARIFGNEWKSVYHATMFCENLIGSAHRNTQGFVDVWNVAYDIYLATHGIAPARSYNPNIKIRGVDDPEYSVVRSKIIALAACREIERSVQSCHGVPGFQLYQDPVNPHLLTWEYVIDGYEGSKSVRPW